MSLLIKNFCVIGNGLAEMLVLI